MAQTAVLHVLYPPRRSSQFPYCNRMRRVLHDDANIASIGISLVVSANLDHRSNNNRKKCRIQEPIQKIYSCIKTPKFFLQKSFLNFSRNPVHKVKERNELKKNENQTNFVTSLLCGSNVSLDEVVFFDLFDFR